jgi:hypothetical protein
LIDLLDRADLLPGATASRARTFDLLDAAPGLASGAAATGAVTIDQATDWVTEQAIRASTNRLFLAGHPHRPGLRAPTLTTSSPERDRRSRLAPLP